MIGHFVVWLIYFLSLLSLLLLSPVLLWVHLKFNMHTFHDFAPYLCCPCTFLVLTVLHAVLWELVARASRTPVSSLWQNLKTNHEDSDENHAVPREWESVTLLFFAWFYKCFCKHNLHYYSPLLCYPDWFWRLFLSSGPDSSLLLFLLDRLTSVFLFHQFDCFWPDLWLIIISILNKSIY